VFGWCAVFLAAALALQSRLAALVFQADAHTESRAKEMLPPPPEMLPPPPPLPLPH
jgi:hypothetical protein